MDDQSLAGSWRELCADWLALAERQCSALGAQWRLVRAVPAEPLFVLAGLRNPPGASLEVAVPVVEPEGSTTPFAVLCGPAGDVGLRPAAQELAELLGERLGPLREAEAAHRRLAALPHDGEADATTGFGGPATWARAIAAEEEHCRLLGHPGAVLMVDAERPMRGVEPEAARRWVQRSAAALRRSVRDRDVLCLLAPAHYAVLAVECPGAYAPELADRLTDALLDVGVGAAVAAAALPPSGRFEAAQATAQQQLPAVRASRHTVQL